MSVGLRFKNLVTVVCQPEPLTSKSSLLLGEEELLEVALRLTTAGVTAVGRGSKLGVPVYYKIWDMLQEEIKNFERKKMRK